MKVIKNKIKMTAKIKNPSSNSSKDGHFDG